MSEISCFLLGGLLSSCFLQSLEPTSFLLEHARTHKQMQWGLMQRHFLPENQGMLFHYANSHLISFWSFNCHLHLSIAFIDEEGVIQEIKTLKAFPEKMDPLRPVCSILDFNFYPATDPIVAFFQKNKVSSSVPVKYGLEMNLGWFERNMVRVGDVLHWDNESNTAFFRSWEESSGYVHRK